MGALYLITNTKNQKRYVGITLRTAKERWRVHVNSALRGSKSLLHRAIRKHGDDAFTVRTLRKSDDWAELCRWEVETIARLKTHWRHGGYNATAGGDGTVDPTEEVKAKRSVVWRRLHADPEFRAKNIETWKRLNADPEFAARRNARMRRMWADDAYRAKKSEESKTTIKRLLAEGYRLGTATPFNDFCREHGLKPKNVRARLRKRGIYGLKDINDPRVREVLDEMIAERGAARRAQSPKTLRSKRIISEAQSA